MSYLVNPYMVTASGGGIPSDDITNAIWATGYPSYVNTCESWTEDSWSSEANEGSLAQASGGGNSSDFFRCCGNDNGGRHSDTSSFNGTSWSAEASMSNTWYELGGDGITAKFIQVAGLGGSCGTYTPCAEAHTYNGTSWTQITNFSYAGYRIVVGGNADGCLALGGAETAGGLCSSWNGSSWTVEEALGYNTGGGCCSGTGSLNLYFCGGWYDSGTEVQSQQNNCNSFNGSWTTEATASTYSFLSARGGSGTSGGMRINGRGGTGSATDYAYLDTTEVFQKSGTWTTKATTGSAVYQTVGGGGA